MLTKECVDNLFTLDIETGFLYWKPRNIKRFDTKYAGKRAGSLFTCGLDKKLYRRVRVNNKDVSEHRVIWVILYGVEPKYIDHINGDGTDNRPANLRECESLSENLYNIGMRSYNTTGLKGVSKRKDSNKYYSFIRIKGKNKYLGVFDTPEEAHETYVAAAKQLHGKFYKETSSAHT